MAKTEDRLAYLAYVAHRYTAAMAVLAGAETESEHVVALTALARVYITTKDRVRALTGELSTADWEEDSNEH